MSLPDYSVEDYKKKRAAYLTAFDEYYSQVPAEPEPEPTAAKEPRPFYTDSTRNEETYLRTDDLGCPLSYSQEEFDKEADEEEEEDLRVLAEKFGDKFPYLHHWLEDFRSVHKTSKDKMPHHESEENATGNLTDQVAKESKDSTASDHSLHDVDTGAKEQQSTGKEGMKATVQHHHATPGPVQAQDLPPAASKEELRKRSEELNK